MDTICVTVRNAVNNAAVSIETPASIGVDRLLSRLVDAFALPRVWHNRPIPYALECVETGKLLEQQATLASQQVAPDETFILLPQMTAAGSPRQRRLQADYDRISKLAAESDLITIEAAQGNPPTKYIIAFSCKGVERLDQNKQAVYSYQHRLGIDLVAGYPTSPPGLRLLTTIFHPNISSQGAVCIGPWHASKSLDELVRMVAEMIQYKVPPTKDSPGDVYNNEAVSWMNRNKHLIPVDPRELKNVGANAFDDLIKIGDEISINVLELGDGSGDDFDINIL